MTKQAKPEVTKAQVRIAIEMTKLVADAIRECGPTGMPSGVLYANMMQYISLDTYNSIIKTLKKTGLVRETGFLLTFNEEALKDGNGGAV